ncbi:tyrosine recombinase XerC [Nitrosomonas sp. Nm166]|uniref:tyrosine recombinase XerC n=1 Tax=Nitrosomonas sp. Nm166 TaxID=1881054 RepID=UPI0008EF5B99|nr:tyrosine recombinase XerC [Nitrosomonas sp. Nm166]SFE25835.1 integrase/recombinase XerC [Nitrosomonas sp. Nm166]
MSSKPESLAAAFIHYLTYERRLSPLTSENYARDIRVLLKHLNKYDLEQAQSPDIRHVIAQLHGKGLSGRSLSRMLSAWRSFYNYLIRHHHYPHNPCNGMRVPKSPQKLPGMLSPDEAVQLLSFPIDKVITARDSAMFELFYSSGLRLAELAKLKPADINFAEGTIKVLGKGGKMRIVPVGDYAIQALTAWLEQRSLIIKPNVTALFLSQHGDAISTRTISYRLKSRARQQGIHQNVHPHILRHSFASHLLQSSGDLRAVQEMLGHAHITSTQVYTHLDFQHLVKVYDTAHPRAKKRN